MPVMFAYMHVCAWLMPTETRRCQVPPELDSLDSENWTRVLCKRIQCPSLLNRFFSLLINLWMCANGLHQLYYPSGGLGLRLISFFCSLHGSLCLGSELFSVGLHRGMCCGNSLSTTNREEGDTWEQGEALSFGGTHAPQERKHYEKGESTSQSSEHIWVKTYILKVARWHSLCFMCQIICDRTRSSIQIWDTPIESLPSAGH